MKRPTACSDQKEGSTVNIRSIGRALVRYFGRPATSVPPKRLPAVQWGDAECERAIAAVERRILTPAALDRVEEAAHRVYPTRAHDGGDSPSVPLDPYDRINEPFTIGPTDGKA